MNNHDRSQIDHLSGQFEQFEKRHDNTMRDIKSELCDIKVRLTKVEDNTQSRSAVIRAFQWVVSSMIALTATIAAFFTFRQ